MTAGPQPLPDMAPEDGRNTRARGRAASEIIEQLVAGRLLQSGELAARRYHLFTAADVPGLMKLQAMIDFFNTHPTTLRQFNDWYGGRAE